MKRLRYPLSLLLTLLLLTGTALAAGSGVLPDEEMLAMLAEGEASEEEPSDKEPSDDDDDDDDDDDIVASGTIGDNVSYTLNSNGFLTISGTGRTYDYLYIYFPNYGQIPSSKLWQYNASTPIRTLWVEEGVTGLGDQLFNSCWGLTMAWIPKSVTYVSPSAFFRTNLQMIFYLGSESQFKSTFTSNPFGKVSLICLGSDDLSPGGTQTVTAGEETNTVKLNYSGLDLTAGTLYCVWYVVYDEQGRVVTADGSSVTFDSEFQTDVTVPGQEAGKKCRFFLLNVEDYAPLAQAAELRWN